MHGVLPTTKQRRVWATFHSAPATQGARPDATSSESLPQSCISVLHPFPSFPASHYSPIPIKGQPANASTSVVNKGTWSCRTQRTNWGHKTNSESTTKGAFHQRRSSLNQVQIWPWPRFSGNFCCTNAVQIKSQVKLGLTLNRRRRRIKLWSSVQLALNSGPRTVIPCRLCPDWWQFGIKCICVDILHPVSGYPSLNNYFNSLLRLL